jgi:hypothetical protein
MWSNFNPGVDRNQRYNFYDYNTHTFLWTDGINVFTQRSGYGNIDLDPQVGDVVFSTHQGSSGALRPVVSRKDSSMSVGPLNFQWPPITVSYNRAVHCAMMSCIDLDSLWYARIEPWPSWTTPIRICPPAPSPMYPSHNIAASKISNKVVVLWETYEGQGQERAFFRLSNNGGLTWQAPTQLSFPPAQGMIPSFHVSSLYAMFDNQDNLHIVASVADSGHITPAGIWHWCPVNNPQWSCIYYYQTGLHSGTSVGYNALMATRPSIVQAPNTGYFYVAWEQFDSLNYEPTTNLLRADIWIAESPDNGMTWQHHQRITTPNTTSKRYPCVGGVDRDTLSVAYLIDSIAGFELNGQGRVTLNPVAIQRIKVPLPFAGEEERLTLNAAHFTPEIYPNPARTYFAVRLPQSACRRQSGFGTSATDRSQINIFDVSGKVIKEIATPSARNDNIVRVSLDGIKNGVYFVQVGNEMVKEKLVVTK